MATYPIITPASEDLFSGYVPAGPRSYFFDVRRVSPMQLQVEFSELVSRDKVWTKQKIVIPAENLRDVYLGMCDAIKALRKAAEEFGIEIEPKQGKPTQLAAPVPQPASVKRAAAPKHRGTGRLAATAK